MDRFRNSRNMRPLSCLSVLLFLILLSSVSCNKSATVPETGYAFLNVNILPMTQEKILENQTVLVQDGRIADTGPAGEITVPADVITINGRGRYLMPGLAEMHGHIPGQENPVYAEDVLFLYLSNGVTTVRNMAGGPYHLELRKKVEDGQVDGPVIFAASPWLSPDNVPSPEAADRVVREYKEAGYDLLKLGSISLEAYEQMARTAHEIGIPFAGHIPAEVGLEKALEVQQASIDHLDRYVEFLVPEHVRDRSRDNGFFGSAVIHLADTGRIDEAVERTLDAGTWNVPTLSLVEHLASPEEPEEMIEWPEMKYMPREVLEGWVSSKHDFQSREDFQPGATKRLVEVRHMLLRELHAAGAPIALGSDAPQFFNVPGFSIHHELRMMVDAGLTPWQVLITGTRNAGLYFGTPEEFGTIEKGRRADLILLNSNPLEDISNVADRAGVMARGEWWPEENLQERLEEIARRVASRD